MSENEIVFASRLLVLPGLFILGGFAVMVATVIRNGKVAELRHRERMAMIERGLTPPEPGSGEAASHQAPKMTLGIVLCGLGTALFMLIAFAGGEVGIGTGVGGAFVAVGVAFVITAMGAKRDVTPGDGRLT